MSDLSSCPFCGGDKIASSHIRDGRSISCISCGASVNAFEPDAEGIARAKWNSRAAQDEESRAFADCGVLLAYLEKKSSPPFPNDQAAKALRIILTAYEGLKA